MKYWLTIIRDAVVIIAVAYVAVIVFLAATS